MTQNNNFVENYMIASEKKVWSVPVFEIINKDRIKTGVAVKTFPEGTLPASSYVS